MFSLLVLIYCLRNLMTQYCLNKFYMACCMGGSYTDTMLTWKEQLIDYMRSRIVSLLTHTLPFLAPSNQNIQRSERRKSTGITFFFLLATWIVHLPLRDACGKVRLLRVSKSPNWPKTLKSSFFHFGKKKTNHDGDFCFVSEITEGAY